MNFYKFSPAILSPLVFLYAQLVGALAIGIFSIKDISVISLIMMAVFVFAVLTCYLFLKIIHIPTADDVSSISWQPSMIAFSSGVLGALSMSILASNMELPDEVFQLQLALSRNFLGLFNIIIVGPVAEEFVFREGIVGEMLRRGANPWTAIIVSAVMFGVMHLNFAQGLYALPLGLLLGIIYYKTGGIVLTSILHILNNGFAAFQLRIMGEDVPDTPFTELFGNAATAYTIMAVCGVLCVLLMRKLWNT